MTGHGPIADAIYAALSGSFGDFGADHAKKAADAVKAEVLNAVAGVDRGPGTNHQIAKALRAVESLFEVKR